MLVPTAPVSNLGMVLSERFFPPRTRILSALAHSLRSPKHIHPTCVSEHNSTTTSTRFVLFSCRAKAPLPRRRPRRCPHSGSSSRRSRRLPPLHLARGHCRRRQPHRPRGGRLHQDDAELQSAGDGRQWRAGTRRTRATDEHRWTHDWDDSAGGSRRE